MDIWYMGFISLFCGIWIGGYFVYKFIQYTANKTHKVGVFKENGKTFQVLGKVINTTADRFGQEMVLYGNENDDAYFIMKTNEFEQKFEVN